MRSMMRWAMILVLPLAYAGAEAQIYRCTAPDGTPIFSDERCGPDAKLVPGITSKKRPAAGNAQSSASAKGPKPEPKSPEELQELLGRCNAGETAACTTWTKGGGPNQLREEEKQQEQSCESGSLADCEKRYCQDGLTEECRRRVFETAKLSGESWYLRDQRTQASGATLYSVRCAPVGSTQIRDVAVTCAATAGPERCSISASPKAFPRLDQAAQSSCQRASVPASR
jgi:hypothetical protein